MLWKIVEKLVILGFILILHSGPSPSEFFIRRIITFAEKSVIRLQCGEDYEKPFNVGLMSSSHVQNERSLDCFLELISYFDVSLLELRQCLQPPFLLFLERILDGFQNKILQRRFRARPQSDFFVHRNPHLAFLHLLDVLHCVDGAVVSPHVEAIPLVDFVLVLFGHLLRHFCFDYFQLQNL